MLNQSNFSVDNSAEMELEKEERLRMRQNSIERSIKLNVKDQQDKIENSLVKLKKDLEQSKKGMSNQKMENQTLKQNHMKYHEDLIKSIYSETNRIENSLIKKSKEIQYDFEFYEAQLGQLREDNEKLVETYEILDLRTIQCEQDVGFRHVYD